MKLRWLNTVLVLIALASVTLPPAQGGILGGLSKAAKAAKKVPLRAITRAELLAASVAFPAGAIFVDVQGQKVLFQILKDSVGDLSGSTDDVLSSVRKFNATAGHLPKQSFVFTPHGAQQMGEKLDDFSAAGPVYIADPIGGALPLLTRIDNGTTLFFRQLRPGLAVPLDAEISKEVLEALRGPAKLENIHVAAIFSRSDVDALRAVATAAGDRLLSGSALEEAIRSGSLEKFRGKTLITIGHIEDGAFVARHADGTVAYSLSIERLEKMADDAGVTIVGAGCSSFCQGSRIGFAEQVTDVNVAAGLKEALGASTLGEMLGAFGHETPLIISEESLRTFAEKRKLELLSEKAHSGKIAGGATAMRIVAPGARAGVFPALLNTLGSLYLIGAILMLFMYRTSRAAFLGAFPRLPSPLLPDQRMKYVVFGGLRELLFIALAPIFLAAIAFTFLLGGWSRRKGLLSFCWTLIRLPARLLIRITHTIAGLRAA